jgi:hypothetical protein
MYINEYKLEAVFGMTKKFFPNTANLVSKFEQLQYALPKTDVIQGYLILDAIYEEMASKKGKRVHEMRRLDNWFSKFLSEVGTEEVCKTSKEIHSLFERERARTRAYEKRFNNESPQRAEEGLKYLSALIFLLALISQYLFGSQLL